MPQPFRQVRRDGLTATARARADRVVAQVGPGSRVAAEGLSPIERAALEDVSPIAGPHKGIALSPRTEPRPSLRGLRDALAERRRVADLAAKLNALHSPSDSEPLVVVLAAVPIHLRLFESTLAELRLRGWRVVVVQLHPHTDLSEEARRVGAECIPLEPFLSHGDLPPRVSLERLRPNRIRGIVQDWARTEGLAAYSPRVVESVAQELADALRFVAAYEALAGALMPSAFLSVSEFYRGVEPIAVVGQRLGIPTIHVQHGNIPDFARTSDFRFDAFCVFGQAYAETLALLGTDRDRVHVTGSPFMDLVPPSPPPERVRGDEEAPFRILFVAGYASAMSSHALLYETLSIALGYAEAVPNTDLVVKFHPAVSSGPAVAGYDIALAEHPDAQATILRHGDTHRLVSECDCVVTHGSSVAIEAAWMRKPVVLLNPLGAEARFPLVSEGTALSAANAAEFTDCMSRVRSGPVIRAEAYDSVQMRYGFVADRCAGHRIADVCEALAAERRWRER